MVHARPRRAFSVLLCARRSDGLCKIDLRRRLREHVGTDDKGRCRGDIQGTGKVEVRDDLVRDFGHVHIVAQPIDVQPDAFRDLENRGRLQLSPEPK